MDPVRDKSFTSRNRPQTILDIEKVYKRILIEEGFADIQIFDVTEATQLATRENFDLYLASLKLSQVIDDEIISVAKGILFGEHPVICLLISAKKPMV